MDHPLTDCRDTMPTQNASLPRFLARAAGSIAAMLALGALAAAGPPRPTPNRVALLIAVQEYGGENGNNLVPLKRPVEDANEIAKTLETSGYKRVYVMTRASAAKSDLRDPRKDSILRVLDSLKEEFQDGTKDDVIFVMMSGHGIHIKKGYGVEEGDYFCPIDTRTKGNDLDVTTLLPMSEVYKRINDNPAPIKVFIGDFCRDMPLGLASKGVSGPASEIGEPEKLADRSPKTALTLLGCERGGISWDGQLTKWLLDALKGGADQYHTGAITTAAFAEFMRTAPRRAPLAARMVWRQQPVVANIPTGGNDNAVIAMLPSAPSWQPKNASAWLPVIAGEGNDGRNSALCTRDEEDHSRRFWLQLKGPFEKGTAPENECVRCKNAAGTRLSPLVFDLVVRDPQTRDEPDTFYILDTKLSNEWYEQFYRSTAANRPLAGDHWQKGTWDSNRPDRAKLPATNVSAVEANAFCKWLKTEMFPEDNVLVRLPTAREWDRAAGYDAWLKHKLKPEPTGPFLHWQRPHPDVAVYNESRPVGTAADDQSPYSPGVHDMAGNGLEWTDDYRTNGVALGSVHNGVSGRAYVVMRGQPFDDPAQAPLTFDKLQQEGARDAKLNRGYGFRVVLEIPPSTE